AMFRRVELAARDEVDALASLEGAGAAMTRGRWDQALGDYYDEHDEIGVGPDARGPSLLAVTGDGRVWEVRQTIDDPAGNHDWAITARIDLDECDEAGELVVRTLGFARFDG